MELTKVIINIDAAGPQGSGKTQALQIITRALSKRFVIQSKDYLNDSEHQLRLTMTLKKDPA